ncbi:hypothetical protein CAPN006_01990 [Capnocytophaga canimorsus]|uniref:GLPGLI family protein n=1 Tax=Capnocytophaga canimorsus TaxID=28188 RepID=UPI001AC1CBC1|nr:GLPGLI family protein [Capnocytophaga canimorsus]GIM55805.1 hypothetical protein CAPN006_01990 [Capnocytophaga canimorsus]
MKKLFLFLACLGVFSCTYAQNYRFVYTTLASMSETELMNIKDPNVKKRIEGRLNRIKDLEYELLIVGNKARYNFYGKFLTPEGYRPPSNRKFYYFDNKVVEDVTFKRRGKHFFVEYPIDFFKWTITEKSAEINGYTCYYAFCEVKYDDYRGIGSYVMEAWFCPDFPMQYGPDDYFGLPGIVFIAKEEGSRFKTVLKRIEILDTAPGLNFPKIEKTINSDQYTDEFNKMMEEDFGPRRL